LALTRADLRTVEEVAAVPRKDVVAIRNVGALTMERLDRALAALGLAYVGAVA
jgi:DNA-directed RNA polymerase alpha subunit